MRIKRPVRLRQVIEVDGLAPGSRTRGRAAQALDTQPPLGYWLLRQSGTACLVNLIEVLREFRVGEDQRPVLLHAGEGLLPHLQRVHAALERCTETRELGAIGRCEARGCEAGRTFE